MCYIYIFVIVIPYLVLLVKRSPLFFIRVSYTMLYNQKKLFTYKKQHSFLEVKLKKCEKYKNVSLKNRLTKLHSILISYFFFQSLICMHHTRYSLGYQTFFSKGLKAKSILQR